MTMTSLLPSSPGTPDAPSPLSALVAFVDALEARVQQDGSGRALPSSRSVFTFSETTQHAAQSIVYSMTGYPRLAAASLRATVGRTVKHLFLRRGAMRHNLSAPVAGAPELDPAMPDVVAVAHLRAAAARLAGFTGTLQPHPTYGRCTIEQVASLQAMHLREHLPGVQTGLIPASSPGLQR